MTTAEQAAAKQRAVTARRGSILRENLGLRDNLRNQVETHPGFFANLKDRTLLCIDDLAKKGATSWRLTKNGMLIAGLRERTRSALTLLRPDAANVTHGQKGQQRHHGLASSR